MRLTGKVLGLFLLLACLSTQAASTIIQLTITVTNSAGTTNGQTLTINSDVRTWTNSVFNSATQILTNNTVSGAANNLITQIFQHPFTGLTIIGTTTSNLVLQTALNGASPSVSMSAGWGTFSLATNTITPAIVVRVPIEVETAAQRTNIASLVAAMINSDCNTNLLTKGIGSTNPVFFKSLAVTNPATGKYFFTTNGDGFFSGSVTALQFTATGTGTNLIGTSHFNDVSNGYFLFQSSTLGVVTNYRNAETLTNLPTVTAIDVPIAEMFTNNLGDGASLTYGYLGWITNAGQGVFLAHTNGTDAVTNTVRFRKALPWDWNAGTVKVGIVSVCSGTNSLNATNLVYGVRAAALTQGTGLTTPTFGTLIRVTNNVAIGAWTNGAEGITAALTIGGSPTASSGILWEIQRHGADPGDTETNQAAFVSQVRIYYQSNTRTNFPTSSP